MTKNIISATNLTKIYRTLFDNITVFENMNIEIEQGSAVAIIGQSGRGKTTMLNILSGLDSPTSGEVIFDDKRIDNVNEEKLSEFRNKNVGFIFQHHYLLEDFTAFDNILIPLRIKGVNIDEGIKSYARELLDSVGLLNRQSHYPDQLSGGERQRIAIVRALIHDPLVVFADEPTGSLDKRNAENIEGLLWSLKDKFNHPNATRS
ncbi:MAG: ABC transporter ATP-binding protein [Brevinematales bacterium]